MVPLKPAVFILVHLTNSPVSDQWQVLLVVVVFQIRAHSPHVPSGY